MSLEVPSPQPKRGRAIGGFAVGAVAVVGSLFALGAVADADSEPQLIEPGESAAVSVHDHDFSDQDFSDQDFSDQDFAEFEAAFAGYEQCLSDQLGVSLDNDDEAAWEAIGEAQWEAADVACESALPAEIAGLGEAYGKFEECLAANDIDLEAEFEGDVLGGEATVFIEELDDFSMASFGRGSGSVTITKTGDDIAVTTSGDVTVESGFGDVDEAYEKAFEACEGELPEDGHFLYGGPFNDDVGLFDSEIIEQQG